MDESRLMELGKITEAWFGLCADRGFVTFSLTFDFGGSGQAFCNVCLAWPDKLNPTAAMGALDALAGILAVFGVTRFEEIAGRYCYALRDAANGPIVGIEAPKVDGGKSWSRHEWQRRWWPERCAATPEVA